MAVKGLLLLLLVFYPCTFSCAGMYKWVDEQGNVNYGDSCPVAECESQSIKTSPQPTSEQIHQSQERMQTLIERTRRMEQIRKQKAARKKTKQEEKLKKQVETQRQCALSRQSLHALQQQRPAFTIDHKGKYLYIEDDARAQEIERLQKFIRKNCD